MNQLARRAVARRISVLFALMVFVQLGCDPQGANDDASGGGSGGDTHTGGTSTGARASMGGESSVVGGGGAGGRAVGGSVSAGGAAGASTTGGSSGSAGADGDGGTGGGGDATGKCFIVLESGIEVSVAAPCEESAGDGVLAVAATVSGLPEGWGWVGPAATISAPNVWGNTHGTIQIPYDALDSPYLMAIVIPPAGEPRSEIFAIDEGSAEFDFFGPGTYALVELDIAAGGECNGGSVSQDSIVNDSASLSALEGVSTVAGSLTISGSSLTNLDSLSCLRWVSGALTIRDTSSLADIEGLSGLLRAAELRIKNNSALEAVNLGGLIVPPSGVFVQNNAVLGDVDLHSLGAVDYNLAFLGNGLSGGSLALDFRRLRRVRGVFSLNANPTLEDLDGFANLERVDVSLALHYNTLLEDISGLADVAWIGDGLSIHNNIALTALAFDNIDYFLGPLTVTSNVLLPTCEATQLGDALRATGWSGNESIFDNMADSCSEN